MAERFVGINVALRESRDATAAQTLIGLEASKPIPGRSAARPRMRAPADSRWTTPWASATAREARSMAGGSLADIACFTTNATHKSLEMWTLGR